MLSRFVALFVSLIQKVSLLQVARDYLEWKHKDAPPKTLGFHHDIYHETAAKWKAHFAHSRVFHKHAAHIRKDKKSKGKTKHFAELVTFVDYLKTLREVLTLHVNVVTARNVKSWTGVRLPGEEMSNTIERSFQNIIARYNEVGKDLQVEMGRFPDEIADGFHEPNPMKADTIAVRVRAVQREVESAVNTAAVLGLFFPGSHLWELRRRMRKGGLLEKSASFWKSVNPRQRRSTQFGVVSNASMDYYLQADDIEKLETTGEVTSPRAAEETWRQVSDDGGDDDSSKRLQFKNPLSGEDNEDEAADAPEALPEPEPEPEPEQKATSQPPQLQTRALKGWRDLVTFHCRTLVNMDGQFILDEDSVIGQTMTSLPIVKQLGLYPLFLWIKCGLQTYKADLWNSIEFVSYVCFMSAFYCKYRMVSMAEDLATERDAVLGHQQQSMVILQDFQDLNGYFMGWLMPTSLLMWIKLFKYVDVIPQMGVLIKVLGKAIGPVLIFTITAMIPCAGLALSYHAQFGQVLINYSTFGRSFNTLMRMAVGDFDFDELYNADPTVSWILFWISALLLVFVLVNIFVAIILNAYDLIVAMDPDASDAANFITMVLTQAQKTIAAAFPGGAGGVHAEGVEGDLDPNVLHNTMDRIEDEAYCELPCH